MLAFLYRIRWFFVLVPPGLVAVVVIARGMSLWVNDDILRGSVLTCALVLFWLAGGLFFASQFLFPLRVPGSPRHAFSVLVGWFFSAHRSSYLIRDGKVQETIKRNRFSRFSGVVLVDSHSAAALDTGFRHSRVIGPDIPQPFYRTSTFFLQRYEAIRGVIDLRRQLRSRRVTAQTRDGLEVTCEVYVDFEIKRAPEKRIRRTVYTFDSNAVYHAVYGEALKKKDTSLDEAEREESSREGHAEMQSYNWSEAVINEAADELGTVLAEYTLDQIYAADMPEQDPRSEIEQRVWRGLQQRVSSRGVHILAINLGAFRVSHEVVAQRIAIWRAEWTRRRNILLAQGKADASQRLEVARAMAQLEMISSITQSLKQEPAELTAEIVTLRLLEALEQMVTSSHVRAMGADSSTADRSMGMIEQALANVEREGNKAR